jgi:hypothetical protein
MEKKKMERYMHQALKENNCQPILVYPEKLFFLIE